MSSVGIDPEWSGLSGPERIVAAMGQCLALAVSWKGTVFRSASPGYATERELVSGEGARINGGRWNRRGSFPAVYAALDFQTAADETFSFVRYYGFSDEDAFPRTFVAVRVELHQVLDLLNDTSARELLGVTAGIICGVDWRAEQDAGREALTQTIGRVARDLGFEGILAPSAASAGGRNLVYFPDRRRPESRWEIAHAEKLTRRP